MKFRYLSKISIYKRKIVTNTESEIHNYAFVWWMKNKGSDLHNKLNPFSKVLKIICLKTDKFPGDTKV